MHKQDIERPNCEALKGRQPVSGSRSVVRLRSDKVAITAGTCKEVFYGSLSRIPVWGAAMKVEGELETLQPHAIKKATEEVKTVLTSYH